MEHGLKDVAFFSSKTNNTLHSCHNFPAGSRQAARGARICETSLLCSHDRIRPSLTQLEFFSFQTAANSCMTAAIINTAGSWSERWNRGNMGKEKVSQGQDRSQGQISRSQDEILRIHLFVGTRVDRTSFARHLFADL